MLSATIQKELSDHYMISERNLVSFGAGENNHVYLLNNLYIVRVSLTPNKTFDNECSALPHLHDLPITIPGPIRHSTDKTIMSYPKVEGKRFDHDHFARLHPTQQIMTAEHIGGLLADLHPRVSTRLIAKAGLPMYDKSRIFAHELQAQHHPKEWKGRIQKILGEYKQYAERNPTIKTLGLLHNDLYNENILVDDNHHIVSIIDRGDIAVGDIHLDFLYLWHPDHDLLNMVCDVYERITNISLDRTYILLCLQIFITKMYTKDPNNRQRAKKYLDAWMG